MTPRATTELDGIYRKIFQRLVPFLMLLWVLAWIDRVNIGFIKLTMLDDLKWSEAVYGFGAGIFFLGYFFFEVPSNLLLQRIGARKTIMRITIGWGLTSIATMFVQTPAMFYALRFLLGVFEAGFYPGIILYLTYWFPNDRRATAFGMFMSASAFAGVIGGPLAGNIMTGLNGVNGGDLFASRKRVKSKSWSSVPILSERSSSRLPSSRMNKELRPRNDHRTSAFRPSDRTLRRRNRPADPAQQDPHKSGWADGHAHSAGGVCAHGAI